jgi:2-C-methyl-D-erythritol 4-phosphate cytidylyltransferase/2-C-methyl-D-erythritol 2,4-cyclodiphosphate synthase
MVDSGWSSWWFATIYHPPSDTIARVHVTAIIAAGGRGARFGGSRPKQLLTLAGRPILQHSVEAFIRSDRVTDIVVALPPDIAAAPPAYLGGAGADLGRPGSKPIQIVEGGGRRQDSVANAFARVSPRCELVVIHDAARPLVTADLIRRTIDVAAEHGAAIAAMPATDTVKRGGADRVIVDTLPRAEIFLAQTPQAFRTRVLRDALALASAASDATDEAMLAERAGHHVRLVDGDPRNIKITTPEDMMLAEAIASHDARPARTGRAGTGYDLHRLVEGRPLILGGVTIPSDRGALGHSDADVVCHALTDAVLGAASLGDIGRHFPDDDPRWKGASSLDLLRRAVAMLADQELRVGNVDVTVILERPRIKDHIDAMRAAVADALGIEIGRVSIKGKTNEGVDAVGRGEAIAAHAIVLVRSR